MRTSLNNKRTVGFTGEIGSGKSYICRKLVELGKERNQQVYNIELDHIGHKVLAYPEVIKEVVSNFGSSILNNDGTINRKRLGDIVFHNEPKLSELMSIMYDPISRTFYEETKNLLELLIIQLVLI